MNHEFTLALFLQHGVALDRKGARHEKPMHLSEAEVGHRIVTTSGGIIHTRYEDGSVMGDGPESSGDLVVVVEPDQK